MSATPGEDLGEKVRQLERVVRDLSLVLTRVVEARESYAIGHERRVAELVGAMAAEMGLPADRAEGMIIAALLHDIGKISVPSEIYGKPDLFTEIEFKLIQTHSQEGYAMLKAIPFPWPVAETVLQHHERLDGSGYPYGLTGEAILPAARVLAVADVVEAMVSHRPHRPPHGLTNALLEIQENRGSLYDAAAVDSCVRLFREKDFTFSA